MDGSQKHIPHTHRIFIKIQIMKPVWGIDLGGTKIEGVILENRNSLNIIERTRVPTEGNKGYEHILGQIIKLIETLKEKTGLTPDTFGMGTPGTIDPYSQTIKNSNTTAMNGQPLKKDLEARLGFPIYMANDANCFAVAEANLGAVPAVVPDAKVVFGIIMGTGVGGGIVVNGKVINGRHGIGGEWGHNFLDASGGPCYCGRTGCVETVLSGPFLERYYTQLTGQQLALKNIVAAHHAQTDDAATATMQRLVQMFGRAMGVIMNVLDPDAVVIGGGVSNVDLLYTEGVEEVKKYLFNPRLDTQFLKPKLGDSAGVFGAALLVP